MDKLQLQLLWQLQELEQKILRKEHEGQHLPSVNEYRRSKKEFELFRQELKAKEDALESKKKELRRRELELQTITCALKEMEEKLYSGEIRNIKELENLERKVSSRKLEKNQLEDEILSLMEIIEREKEELSLLKSLEEKKNQEQQQLLQKARNDLRRVQREMKELNIKREELLQMINKDLFVKYLELSKRMGGGRCVSLVKEGFCGICNVSLPSSFKGMLYTPGQLVFCENCGCLLVPGD